MYKFYMTIGDWSGDGHGRSEDFLVVSNLPVERVREAHFQIEEATGVNIEGICSAFEEDEIDPETVTKIKELGFCFENSSGMGDGIISVSEMAKLWVFLLMKADQELKLEIIEDNTPTLHFFGYDEQNRHWGSVGYGLFRGV